MGFGLLFVGYFFLIFYPVGSMGILPNAAVIGCIIMFFACARLERNAPDCKGFFLARVTLIPYFILALAELVLDIAASSVPESGTSDSIFENAVALSSDVMFGIFSVFLFLGIFKLAKEVELSRLASHSGIVMSISVVYTLLAIISDTARFIGDGLDGTAVIILNYIGFAAFIFEYAAIFAGLWHIFSCYARICLEGDEDMPYREDLFDKIVALTKRGKK